MTSKSTKEVSGRQSRRMAREPGSLASSSSGDATSTIALTEQKKAMQPSKAATLVAMLHRAEGATIDQMVEATGWQPHTARAALTGLKKKGHEVSSEKADSVSRYRIEKGAAAT